MPFFRIPDDTLLYYITNTVRGDASDLDPHKPVVLLIPHDFTDVTWLREQFQDARLSSQYNLIGIDLSNTGLSRAPFNAKKDSWVDAADIAVAHEVLQLPPCHLFASGSGSCAMAMCFAILFPEKCLSLFLCSCPVQRGDLPEWIMRDLYAMMELWCFPRDLESFHLAIEIVLGIYLNNQADIELQDELVAWWQRQYYPKKSSLFGLGMLRTLRRPFYSDKELQAIRAPTFVVHGDRSVIKLPDYLRSFCEKLPNSNFLVVRGGPDCMPIVPEYASVINRLLARFLDTQSHVPTPRVSLPDLEGICRTALARLADFANNPEIAQRDPTSTTSFSRLGREDITEAVDLMNRCLRYEKDAIDAFDECGEPMLRLTDKVKNETVARKVKTPPMAAEAEIVRVESCTIFETEV